MLPRFLLLAGAFAVSCSAWARQGEFVHLLGAETAQFKEVDSAGEPRIERLLATDLWGRMRNGFAIPEQRGTLVASSEAWYRARPQLVEAILVRARRYLFHIVQEVERRGMPTELALLPLVESGFNPLAVSSAQAVGLWQFIPATGTRYGLPQDEHYDARRDIVSSTSAALDYLQALHGMFKDWALALAAYNWGEAAVSRAVEASRARGEDGSFDKLRLPEETRNYVPRLQAVKNLVAEPKRFGMDLGPLPNEPYFAVMKLDRPISLAAAADLAGMTLQDIALLNPGWSAPHTASRRDVSIVVPVENAARFRSNYARLKKR